jgi:hypothetical protein
VDRTVIALWLLHESVDSTQIYVHTDIQLKEQAMAKDPAGGGLTRTISTKRSAARVSGDALIMPTLYMLLLHHHRGFAGSTWHNPKVGIMTLMPISA